MTFQGSLKEVLNFSFNHRIVLNGSDMGHFDESNNQNMVIATDSNKLVLQNTEAVFHINEQIFSVAVLKPSQRITTHFNCDYVVVGTEKSMICFDVYNNKTIFHRDMPEGTHCLKIGKVDDHPEEVIVCGCGSSVWGISNKGEDVFWTTLGDDILDIDLCDIDGDGLNELLIGTTGQEIKVLKNQCLLREMNEGDPCIVIHSVSNGKFAFGLSNGVIGVYKQYDRLWRMKLKYIINSFVLFPLMHGKEDMYLTCVWEHGKVEVRSVENGETCTNISLDGEVADSVVVKDKSSTASKLLISFKNGRVRGVEYNSEFDEVAAEISVLRDFGRKKHNIMEELKTYEATERRDSLKPGIPADTVVNCNISLTLDHGLRLHVDASNGMSVKAVLLFAEGIFEDECHAVHPRDNVSNVNTEIRPIRNSPTSIFVRALIGPANSNLLRVFEHNQDLPRFATYVLVPNNIMEPDGFVQMNITARPDLLNRWLRINFLIQPEKIDALGKDSKWMVTLMCCYTKEPLQLRIADGGELIIAHNQIDVAGEILQSIVKFAEIKQMTSKALFPLYQEELAELISTMDDRQSVTDKLNTEWTERLNFIRETVVRAEDALMVDQTSKARKLYVKVAMLNHECMAQRQIYLNSMDALVGALKRLNQLIKFNSQLKIGEDANELVQDCRKLLAVENFVALGKRLQFTSL